jgi:HEPN domain-containing protein
LPRKTDSCNPADWLYFAESELSGLRLLLDGQVAYAMCRSQLAAALEKVLKVELIRLGWRLVKTHDLEVLAGGLRARQSDLMEQVDLLREGLAEVYYTARYPGFDLEDPDWPTLRSQLEAVAALADRVKARLAPAA